mmetsp:Transcript_20220/g.47179  ORF Transcript_20220/g.47179 Transcript_20220/m.47179 type:complete len:328 (-) Transcript_20220:314-1297(-)
MLATEGIGSMGTAWNAETIFLVQHFPLHVVQKPRHVFTLQLCSTSLGCGQVPELHVHNFGLELLEQRFVLIQPDFSKASIILHHLWHLDIIRSVCCISEEMSYSRTRNHLDVTTTSPHLECGFQVVATPTNHASIVETKPLPPIPANSEDPARGGRRHIWLRGDVAVARISVYQVQIPLEAPVPSRAHTIAIEVVLRNDVQKGHRQDARELANSHQQRLQPVDVHTGVRFEENKHLGVHCHCTHCSHLRSYEAHTRRGKYEERDERGDRSQCIQVGSVRLVAVRHHHDLIEVPLRSEVQDARQRASDMVKLLSAVGNDDGHLHVLEV